MKKKKILSILAVLTLSFGMLLPALATKTTKAPKQPLQSAEAMQQGDIVRAQYPKKYTQTYIAGIKDEYKVVGKDEIFYVALDMLKGTNGDFSRKAILGNNLTLKPVKIEFKDLGTINKNYQSFDALGWKRGSRLYIYVSQRHADAPAIAIAALLSHEALHQDEYNSLSEETYAWTMEAAVWCELLELNPNENLPLQPLVVRENTIKKLFEKGEYTNKYIKKTVYSNPGYQNLPEASPGFEAL